MPIQKSNQPLRTLQEVQIAEFPSQLYQQIHNIEAEAFQHPHWQQNSHSKDRRKQARPKKFNTHSKNNNIRIAAVTASTQNHHASCLYTRNSRWQWRPHIQPQSHNTSRELYLGNCS
ncbi:hypothetical protein Nepgr_017405 [Nepenthes gracilis]|uniref:Uncharacterized protein n=1 Tax=Nepenthes gracilis TaxID=150966 RepID=A0AAD3SRK1_NEPGR|nr:hypothetical protein Nepgr_017405 [Nepenthes gracilis]